jgi:LysM repeat protein
MRFKIVFLIFIISFPIYSLAQKTATLIYIDQYKDIAVKEMKRTGIPASITLAQGIVESNSGESNLATKANNHFGIKCKAEWKGATYYQDDDTKQECFRVYENAESSFIDHSNFLKKRSNYAPLFELDPVDDSAWCYGLKKAGYATASDYPKKLLKVIQDYELSQYNFPELADEVANFSDTTLPPKAIDSTQIATITLDKMKVDSVKVDSIKANTTKTYLTKVDSVKVDSIKADITKTYLTKVNFVKVDSFKVDSVNADSKQIQMNPIKGIESSTTATLTAPKAMNAIRDTIITPKPLYQYPKENFKVNGVSAIWVKAGTSFLSIADKYHIPLYKLFAYNDLPETDLLVEDQLIFLAAKKKEGNKTIHISKEGESLYMISQAEGIQLQSLLSYNTMNAHSKIAVGTSLLLIKPIEQKKTLPNVLENSKLQGDSLTNKDWNFFKKKKTK